MKNNCTLFIFCLLFAMVSCTEYTIVPQEQTPVIPEQPDNSVDPDDDKPVDPEKPAEPDLHEEYPEQKAMVGSIIAFHDGIRTCNIYDKDYPNTTLYNIPLFRTFPEGAQDGFWDNLVEEMDYAGLDYIIANCRGRQPRYPEVYKDHGDPTRLSDLVQALQRRGLTGEDIKIAIFDDCPASWEAARNLDLGIGYGTYNAKNPGKYKPYPLKDIELGSQEFRDSVYRFIWDCNIKLALETIPDEYLFKYNGRPVIYFWGARFTGKVPGKMSYILEQIRKDCIAEFQMDPLLIVSSSWISICDSSVGSSPATGGVHDWFNTEGRSYSAYTFNDLTVGVAVPGFLVNDKINSPRLIDSRHGAQLHEAFDHMARENCQLIMLEGFNDVLENAAYCRSTDKKYYDFPNQRLNILRKRSRDPYPADFRVECETCDEYNDMSSGNSGGQYRLGNLDVSSCDDDHSIWCVTDTEPKEWLKWVELPFCDGTSEVYLRYRSQGECTLRLYVGNRDVVITTLPSTEGKWMTAKLAEYTFQFKAWYPVILNIISGHPDMNYFRILQAKVKKRNYS